jgi:hypothetical protein
MRLKGVIVTFAFYIRVFDSLGEGVSVTTSTEGIVKYASGRIDNEHVVITAKI